MRSACCLCVSECLKQSLIKLCVYIMAPEAISTAYFLKQSHRSVCPCVYPPTVARQRLGEYIPAVMNTFNNSIIAEHVVFSAVRVFL
jgi:hypothetical protein